MFLKVESIISIEASFRLDINIKPPLLNAFTFSNVLSEIKIVSSGN